MNKGNQPNKGVFFKNEKKASEASPDYSGSFNLNGAEYSLAGWQKMSKSGISYISLAIRPFTAKPPQKKEPVSGANSEEIFPDVPF
jgi:uncharacterized protein (DUF736 family)